MTITPGCYIDSRHGHYTIPAMIQFAHGYGFPLDPFAKFTLIAYDNHYHMDEYPTGAMDELAIEAEDWLNNALNPDLKCEGHAWGWNDGDFGLYPIEDD